MITIFSILALAVFFDLFWSGGDGLANIINSFHKPNNQHKSDTEALTERITELNEELDYLEDELAEAIEAKEAGIELGIRRKIITKNQILNSYLNKLKHSNGNKEENP